MAVKRPSQGDLSPDLVARHGFTAAFRGYEQIEVREFLERVAEEIRTLRERVSDLESQPAEVQSPAPPAALSEADLMGQLGEHTVAILTAAHAAADDIRKRAEAEVGAITTDARQRATELLADAERRAHSQVSEAERQSAALVADADNRATIQLADANQRSTAQLADADEISRAKIEEAASQASERIAYAEDRATTQLAEAESTATKLTTEAAEKVDKLVKEAERRVAEATAEAEPLALQARAEAEADSRQMREEASKAATEMVAKAKADAERMRSEAERDRRLTVEGAQAIREKILADLSRRRRVAAVQIEQLRAGRERLLAAYGLVRRTLEDVTDELQRADAEARTAADEAGRRMEQEEASSAAADEVPRAEAVTSPKSANHALAATPDEPADKPPDTDEKGVPSVDASHSDESPAGGPDRSGAPASISLQAEGSRTSGATVNPAGASRSGRSHPASGVTSRAAVSVAVPSSDDADVGSSVSTEPPGGRRKKRRMRLVQGGAELAAPADTLPSLQGSPAVDDLFSRIRADRADEVAKARQVLQPPTAEGSDEQVEPAGLGDPVSSPDDEDLSPVRSDEDEALLQRRDQATLDLDSQLVRKLKRVLQDEQNTMLDRLRNMRGEPNLDALIGTESDQAESFSVVAAPLLQEAVLAGAAFARSMFSGASAVDPEEHQAAASRLAAALGRSIVDPLRPRLARIVGDRSGEDEATSTEGVGALYREWKTQRIERFAGDQVAAAFAQGTWQAAGAQRAARWVVDDVDGPCPDCDDNALAGFLPLGEAFPTGVDHPPAHTGCRCLLVPEAD